MYDKLGIELDKMDPNPGKRAIAKLCLNSLWGKSGQRLNINKTKYITKLEDFYNILLNNKVENLSIIFVSEEMVQTTYNMKDGYIQNNFSTNIHITCFTTSHARMMLYGVLDKLGDRVLGYDTDSAWFVEKEGENLIETGDGLRELDGNYITDWVGTGPKSYSYKVSNGDVVCKTKGFTLNYEKS